MSGRNIRGGKAFKKGKKGPKGIEEKEEKFSGRGADQDYARVMRLLGDRRVLCFCNDGKERICKIRGALCKGPKKQIIVEGDIVLISFRDYGDAEDSDTDISGEPRPVAAKKADVADILHSFSSKHQNSIRKEEGIHRSLFLVVTTAAGSDDTLIFEEDEETGAATATAAESSDDDVDIGAI